MFLTVQNKFQRSLNSKRASGFRKGAQPPALRETQRIGTRAGLQFLADLLRCLAMARKPKTCRAGA
jgi:hypothetical protein